jgi:CheY-like chemotaxis protein
LIRRVGSPATSRRIAPPLRRATILVIDDDQAIIDIFVRILTLEGHDVQGASDCETGLHSAALLDPDVILVDLRMPVVDGLEFLRRLRAQPGHSKTPAAVITGDYFTDHALTDELTHLGATLHFKPVWCQDVIRIVDDLLREASHGRQTTDVGYIEPAGDLQARRTLLLVDDCVAQRDLYETALRMNFTILTASRGDEGLAIAARELPDAIVLDVMMPGLDGWQTCRRLKSNATTADIPIIFLTGQDDGDLSEQAAAVGGSVVLRKPCPVEQLRDTICSTLSVRFTEGR